MRAAVSTALAVLVVLTMAACGPANTADTPDTRTPVAAPSDDEEATFEDYCATVHQVNWVQAEQTPDGVLVTWDSSQTIGVPEPFVVYRRPAGTTAWQRVEQVERLDDNFTYVDTQPAEQPGVAYEYWVTFVVPECGGESELCPTFVCDPPPAATPRQN
ncbi:hypothetical protein [Cellulomonas wangsupingiae]|uniref:Fibronectin type-III domain-containing protein n=1 Tax=Cellulomonas wangsupingiae TaxID=2968085 RepID=A0ABY5K699_9CELL|nr:hypothetical protein [Cellulomonas wangsupingiae]MCC2333665.1 hypothetical protein [Cellulomonas wangsupingiae]UUI64931.1 hypothetical protein NP075_17750 [Cellulomonas wangsupingiae]